MTKDYRSKKDVAEQAAPVQKKYEYKICRGAWNGKTRERDGCGKHFTMDSVADYCPDCGLPLAVIRYNSPVTERVQRIHMEKCGKCADSVNALPCFCDKPPKPEYCKVCGCRECCREQSEKAEAVMKGEYSLSEWMRDCIRKRKEEEAAREKKRAEQPCEPSIEAAAVPATRSPNMKSIGQVLDQMVGLTAGGEEIPF
jgi:hypothetical protein